MSLATRCTSCGTVFRVVQDQLRVSSGWVRCGRCSEVFNAIESLVDLEADRPAEGAAPSAHGARVMDDLARLSGQSTASAAPARTASAPPEAGAPTRSGEDLDLDLAPARREPGPAAAADALDIDIVIDPPGAPDRAAPLPDPEVDRTDSPAPAAHAATDAAGAPGDLRGDLRGDLPGGRRSPAAGATDRNAAPAFVRQADRAARWRSAPVRAALMVVAVLATVALAWQVHLSHHDWLAARWPVLASTVTRLCAWSGCTVEAPRRIEALVVESSGLVRAGAAGTYRLTAVLRNREAWAVRTPSIDLTLTDAVGGVVARRVFTAAELGAVQAAVAAGTELSLSATLRHRQTPIVGYTIEIFYP